MSSGTAIWGRSRGRKGGFPFILSHSTPTAEQPARSWPPRMQPCSISKSSQRRSHIRKNSTSSPKYSHGINIYISQAGSLHQIMVFPQFTKKKKKKIKACVCVCKLIEFFSNLTFLFHISVKILVYTLHVL